MKALSKRGLGFFWPNSGLSVSPLFLEFAGVEDDLNMIYFHLAAAAFFATDVRSSLVMFAARAFAPACPLLTLPDGCLGFSCMSPIESRATVTAHPIRSAGLFSPRGPVAIMFPLSDSVWLYNPVVGYYDVDFYRRLQAGHQGLTGLSLTKPDSNAIFERFLPAENIFRAALVLSKAGK